MNSPAEPARPTESKTGIKYSIAGHHEWRESIAGPDRDFDEIDELVEDLRAAEFELRGARP